MSQQFDETFRDRPKSDKGGLGLRKLGIRLAGLAQACLLSQPMLAQAASVPPPPGLVSWWTADGDASDLLGMNNGYVYGATYTTGMVGRAFWFDGNGASVTAPTLGLPTGSGDRAIEFWVRLGSLPASPNHAFMAGYGLKFYLICQDLNQLRSRETGYGADEAISSNCHIQNAFPPNRLETAEHLSRLTGQTTVIPDRPGR